MPRMPGIRFALFSILIVLTSASLAQKPDEHPGVISFLVASGIRQSAGGKNALVELVDRAAQLKVKPSFIVAVGDVTDSGRIPEFDAVSAGVKRAAAAGISFYALPGVNDVSGLAEGKERYTHIIGKTYQSFDLNSAHFILLDSSVALRNLGHLDKTELEWLDRDLKRVKPESPVFVFLYHSVGQQSPSDRPLDNDYDLLVRLKGHNAVAIFSGDSGKDTMLAANGITMLTSRSASDGTIYRVTLSQLLASVDRLDLNAPTRPEHVISLPAATKTKGSMMRVIWDDPDIPFLERRRPAATLSPRAVADNPDKERAQYRIDGGLWKPLIKDRRDIWSETFLTKDLAIGIHTTDILLTTSNDQRFQDELIFEVERDAFEATRKWAIDLPSSIQSSPLLEGSTLYVSCNDGKLYAVNTANGKRRWVFPAKAAFIASPVLVNGVIYIGSTDKTFYAIEASNGHMKWRFDAPGPILASAACAHGVVCFGIEGIIYGLDLDTGDKRWTHPAEGPFESAAATDGEAFYLGGWDSSAYALDSSSGTERWHVTVGGNLQQSPAAASPCVRNDRVYFNAGDGMLHCLETAHGAELWAKRAPPGGDAISSCSPTVCGNSVIVCGTGKLGSVYSFSGLDGQLQWHTDIGQSIMAAGVSPAPNKQSLALMGVRGKTVVLSASSGKQLWGYELGPGNIFSTPQYDGSMLYTTTMANDVQAINGPGVGR